MVKRAVPWDVPMMQVTNQPSTGSTAPDSYLRKWKDGFHPKNFSFFQPNADSLPQQKPDPPHKQSPSSLPERKFINSPLGQARGTRTRAADDPPQRGTSAEDKASSKRRRLTGSKFVRLSLSSRRPLRNASDVHRDIWRNILSYCDPRFLLEAKTVDRLMYNILTQSTTTWRRSRELYLPEAAPCPTRLSEQQYVDLLVGRGCQVPHCLKACVTAVAWPFLGRLCLDCIHEKTLSVADIPIDRRHTVGGEPLYLALPMGQLAARRHVRTPVLTPDGNYRNDANGHVILRSDWEKLESEYLEMVSSHNEAIMKEWYDKKRRDTQQHMQEVQRCDKTPCIHPNAWSITGRNMNATAEARKRFFIEEAARLDPPMSDKVLKCMSAYHKALGTGNLPSPRAWRILKSKILPFREIAETLAAIFTPSPHWLSPQAEFPHHNVIHLRTKRLQQPPSYLPEQEFVIELGKEEFNRCLRKGVADCDLLLLTLKNVFDGYDKMIARRNPTHLEDGSAQPRGLRMDDAVTVTQTPVRPIGLNYDNTEGPYVLSFDDAAMIIQEVMEPVIRKDSGRGREVYRSLRCIACAKTAYTRDLDFEKGMEHVYVFHSNKIGEGEEYWRYAQKHVLNGWESGYAWNHFPFYTTPWSRCLPLIPNHRDPETLGTWHPDNNWDYVQFDPGQAKSAFEGRRARDFPAAKQGFLAAARHATATMHGVNLSTQALMRIALKYAIDLTERHQARDCSLHEFLDALPSLRDINPALKLKFMCGSCLADEDQFTNGVHVKHGISIKQLYAHWQKKHAQAGLDWRLGFMHLPSDRHLLEEMTKSDAKLQEGKDEIMAFAAQEERKPLKKRPNPKAKAILTTRLAMTAFEQLFPTSTETHG